MYLSNIAGHDLLTAIYLPLQAKMLQQAHAMQGDECGYDDEVEHLRKVGSPPGLNHMSSHDPITVDK